jgi:hypothetical protein
MRTGLYGPFRDDVTRTLAVLVALVLSMLPGVVGAQAAEPASSAEAPESTLPAPPPLPIVLGAVRCMYVADDAATFSSGGIRANYQCDDGRRWVLGDLMPTTTGPATVALVANVIYEGETSPRRSGARTICVEVVCVSELRLYEAKRASSVGTQPTKVRVLPGQALVVLPTKVEAPRGLRLPTSVVQPGDTLIVLPYRQPTMDDVPQVQPGLVLPRR